VRLSKAQAAEDLLLKARDLVDSVAPGRTLREDDTTLPERAVLSYVHRSMAVGHAVKKTWHCARASTDMALRRMPTNATAHYMRGLVHEELGELGEACVSMLKAITLDPDFKLPYLVLASCQIRLQCFDDAEKASRACLRRYPDSPTAFFNLGQALYNQAVVHDGVMPADALAALRHQAAVALCICSEHVPEQWRSTHGNMLAYLRADAEARQKIPRQPISVWHVSGWRP